MTAGHGRTFYNTGCKQNETKKQIFDVIIVKYVSLSRETDDGCATSKYPYVSLHVTFCLLPQYPTAYGFVSSETLRTHLSEASTRTTLLTCRC